MRSTEAERSVTSRVIIVAGQSNATGVYGGPRMLPSAPEDDEIDFWWSHYSASAGLVTLCHQDVREPPTGDRTVSAFGFGPKMTMARALNRSWPEEHRVVVVKVSENGSSITDHWRPQSGPGFVRLTSALEEVTAARRADGDDVRVDSLLWVQGEADVREHAHEYEALLTSFIAAVRNQFGSGLRIVISRLHGPTMVEPNRSIVRRAQQAVADADDLVAWIDTDDLPLAADNVHFRGPGLMALGERAAAAVRGFDPTAR